MCCFLQSLCHLFFVVPFLSSEADGACQEALRLQPTLRERWSLRVKNRFEYRVDSAGKSVKHSQENSRHAKTDQNSFFQENIYVNPDFLTFPSWIYKNRWHFSESCDLFSSSGVPSRWWRVARSAAPTPTPESEAEEAVKINPTRPCQHWKVHLSLPLSFAAMKMNNKFSSHLNVRISIKPIFLDFVHIYCIPLIYIYVILYIRCCICQARDSSDSSSIAQRCSQNDWVMPMGMEVLDSDALKWKNGSDERTPASIFGLEGERSESRWNDSEFNKRTSMALFKHRFVWSSNRTLSVSNNELTFKFSQFELHAFVILLVILNGAMHLKQLNCFNCLSPTFVDTNIFHDILQQFCCLNQCLHPYAVWHCWWMVGSHFQRCSVSVVGPDDAMHRSSLPIKSSHEHMEMMTGKAWR